MISLKEDLTDDLAWYEKLVTVIETPTRCSGGKELGESGTACSLSRYRENIHLSENCMDINVPSWTHHGVSREEANIQGSFGMHGINRATCLEFTRVLSRTTAVKISIQKRRVMVIVATMAAL